MITDGLSTICCDYSSVSDVCVCVCMCSVTRSVQLFVTPGTVALQAPLSMQFSRQEHWSGLPIPSPGDLPDPGTELPSPVSPALQVGALALCLLGTCCSASFPVPLVSPQASPFLLHWPLPGPVLYTLNSHSWIHAQERNCFTFLVFFCTVLSTLIIYCM